MFQSDLAKELNQQLTLGYVHKASDFFRLMYKHDYDIKSGKNLKIMLKLLLRMRGELSENDVFLT